MDQGQSRMLLVLSVVLAAVAGLLYWQGPETVEADPEATAAVWEVEEQDVVSVKVEREAGVLRLEKGDGGWRVVEPVDDRADADQVHELLDALREIKRGLPVEAPPERAADFGLGDPPKARVTVGLADGAQKTLEVGIEAPIGFRTYVRGADGGVVAVNGDPNRPLQASGSRYRDTHLFRFDPATVRRVVIRGPQGTLDVSGQTVDWWLDGFGRADPDRVDDLVVGLTEMRFDQLVDREGPIESPVYEVTVGMADGTELGLKTGQGTPMGVLCSTTDGRLGFVYPDLLAQLGRGPTDVGQRSAFDIRMDRTERITVSRDGRVVELVRNGPAWSAAGLDDGAAWDAVDTLAGLQRIYQREPPPAPSAWWVTVEVHEGERHRTVRIGADVVDGFRALADEQGSLLRLPADALDAWFAALPQG